MSSNRQLAELLAATADYTARIAPVLRAWAIDVRDSDSQAEQGKMSRRKRGTRGAPPPSTAPTELDRARARQKLKAHGIVVGEQK